MSIYLDYNASTPVDERIIKHMIDVYQNYYGNADSRTHKYGTNSKELIEKSRGRIASLLNVEKNEIIFTSGATESDNLAILGISKYGQEKNRKHIITTAIEHKAVLEPVKYLAGCGFEIDFIKPDESGRIDANELLSLIRPDTLLVSVMHANNETGIVQPVVEIGEALSGTETFFHIDAAQSCGKLVDELRQIKYDMLSITAHKMYGPQGVGALVLKRKNYKRPPVKPVMFGGSHEGGLRPGTLPVALISGFGFAAEIAEQEHKNNNTKYSLVKREIINQLDVSRVNYEINGCQDYCIPNTINISFIGVDSEALMLSVKDSYSISNGSACTSHDYAPSHVLVSMGLEDTRIESAVRLSWGYSLSEINIKPIIDSVLALNQH